MHTPHMYVHILTHIHPARNSSTTTTMTTTTVARKNKRTKNVKRVLKHISGVIHGGCLAMFSMQYVVIGRHNSHKRCHVKAETYYTNAARARTRKTRKTFHGAKLL